MFCPDCNQKLLPLTLKTDTGNITIDYCASCGGVWADQGEVNFIKEKDLGSLKSVLPLDYIPVLNPSHFCPRDREKLTLFKSESVPQNLEIYRCQKCSGIWFPQNSFLTFKEAQATKLDYFKKWNIPLHSIYAILLPVLLIAVMTGGIAATLIGLKDGTDTRTRAKDVLSEPLVVSPEDGQVLISFSTYKEATTKIKYWLNPNEVTEIWASATPQTTHTVILKNLETGKAYSYQIMIVDPEPLTTPIYVFTAKAK